MDCPQCRSDEINDSGVCLVCGYRIPAETPVQESKSGEEERRSFPGMIEMDYSGSAQEPSPEDELPQWRKELSQRLLAIKQKRGAAEAPGTPISSEPSIPAIRNQAAESPGISPARRVEGTPIRKSAPKPRIPAPRQKMLQPLQSEPNAVQSALQTAGPQEIQELIDNVVSRQAAAPSAAAPVADTPIYVPEPLADDEGKLILLSRTLSGLVDLIFIVLCTGGFIVAADFFSGIIVLDSISLLDFSVLFLLTYFVYSMFFLATSNQTVGMMITDLRVVDADERRPSLSQLQRRCCAYLLSLFGLGIGLLWSLFNRESLCFHDRFSDTRVIRV